MEINLKLRRDAVAVQISFLGLVSLGNQSQHILHLSKCILGELTPSHGLHLSVTSYFLECSV